jgi:DNA-binding transcriptional MerR regulator
MTKPLFYSSAAVAELLGVGVRDLNAWVRLEHLAPTPLAGGGHVWTEADVQRAVDFHGFIGLGIVPARAAELLAELEANGSADVGSRFRLVPVEPANVIEVDAAELSRRPIADSPQA